MCTRGHHCRDVDQTRFGDRLIYYTNRSWQISLLHLLDLYSKHVNYYQASTILTICHFLFHTTEILIYLLFHFSRIRIRSKCVGSGNSSGSDRSRSTTLLKSWYWEASQSTYYDISKDTGKKGKKLHFLFCIMERPSETSLLDVSDVHVLPNDMVAVSGSGTSRKKYLKKTLLKSKYQQTSIVRLNSRLGFVNNRYRYFTEIRH